MKYFERGIERQSLTARLPNSVINDLTTIKDRVNNWSDTKVSRNDLLTIGGILVSELKLSSDELKEVQSLSDLYALLKGKLTDEPTSERE